MASCLLLRGLGGSDCTSGCFLVCESPPSVLRTLPANLVASCLFSCFVLVDTKSEYVQSAVCEPLVPLKRNAKCYLDSLGRLHGWVISFGISCTITQSSCMIVSSGNFCILQVGAIRTSRSFLWW